jgi:hypothetical protein
VGRAQDLRGVLVAALAADVPTLVEVDIA